MDIFSIINQALLFFAAAPGWREVCEGFWEEAELPDNDSLHFGPPLQGRAFYKP